MREAVKKGKAAITPVEGVESASDTNGGRRGYNYDDIQSDTQEILVESSNQESYVDVSSAVATVLLSGSGELLQPSEAAFYLPMEEIRSVDEIRGPQDTTCRQPQWSSNDDSDDTEQRQKKRWDKTRSTWSPLPMERFADSVHEPEMRMPLPVASPPLLAQTMSLPRAAGGPPPPPPPPGCADVTEPSTSWAAEIDSFFGVDTSHPSVPAPPPVPALVTQPAISAPPPAPSIDENPSPLNFQLQVQKKAEQVNTNPELGKGDELKFPESEPITDLTEIARETERILKEVEKTLKSITEIMKDAQENEVENTVYLNSKFRNKFLILRNLYFSLPKQPIKQRETMRIKTADLFCKDENFLLYTKATIEYAYHNGYDEDGQLLSSYTRSLVNPLTILYNFTDAADEFTVCVCKTPGLMSLLVKIAEEQFDKIAEASCDKIHQNLANRNLVILVNGVSIPPFEFTFNDLHLPQYNRQVVCACVAVTYNCSTRERNRKSLRNVGAVKMLIQYLDCPDKKFQLDALFGLAFLCDEHESEIFQARMPLIQFFMKKMEKAIKDESKKCSGLSLYEMTRACGRLAINDVNKHLLGEAGAIDILLEIASKSDGDPEQIDATEALWTLSFEATNKERIRSNTKAMELLTYLADSGENKQMAKSARGCLWTIGKDRSSTGLVHAEPKVEKQIMISYQWKYQELILKVRDRLGDLGYKIWIDVEQMGGSTLEAMATAVEQSTVVLVAMSQTYKDSSNTRAEAEYAFTQGKRIIPLRVENNYKPDGWLGIIVGSKLYYDISSEEYFEPKMNELSKEILAQGSEPSIQPAVAAPVEFSPNPSVPVNPKQPRCTIDEDETNRWLRDTQFKSPHLNNLTVEHLRCLRNMKTEASAFYYDYLHRLVTKEASLDQMSDMATISNKLDELG